MNYKQMLEKFEELEARLRKLEQIQHTHSFPVVPQDWWPNKFWPDQDKYIYGPITSNPQDAFK